MPKDTVKAKITIVSASKLPNADLFDVSDPYVIVKDTQSKRELCKTPVVHNDLNPKWSFEAVVEIPKGADLLFSVFDSDTWSSDDLLGEALMPCKDFSGVASLVPGKKGQKMTAAEPKLTLKIVLEKEEGCCAGCSVM